MHFRALLSVTLVTVVAASLTIATPALAASTTGYPAGASARPALPGTLATTTMRFGVGSAGSSASRGAVPDQEEIFICDTEYGIVSLTPEADDSGNIVQYQGLYTLQNECPIPMFMLAQISMTEINKGEIDAAQDGTGFGEEVSATSVADMDLNSNFIANFDLNLVLFPGFEWIFAPPQCAGIGTVTLTCFFSQTASTPPAPS